MRAIDLFERRDAHRAAGAVHELQTLRQQLIDPVLHDRMRLTAADFHEGPRSRHRAADLRGERGGDPPVPILVEILHGSVSGASSSSSCPSSLSSSYVRAASSASITLSAKPTCTST